MKPTLKYRRYLFATLIALAPAFMGASASWAAEPPPAGEGRAEAPGKASSSADLKERFALAQRLFDQGDDAAALDIFREVYSASRSPNARLMIGHCLMRAGRLAEAYDELYQTMIEAGERAESEPKYTRTRDAAAAELTHLERKIGKLIVAVGDPSHVDVTMNGSPLAAERFGVPFAVDPGDVVVVASRRGGRSIRLEANVTAGVTKTLVVVFPDEARALPAPSNEARARVFPTKAPQRGRVGESDETFVKRGGLRTLGFVAAGVGALGMVTFGVAGGMVEGKLSTLEAACGSSRCRDLKYASVIDSGKTLTALTNIGLVAGVVGLAGGGAMIAWGGPSAGPPPRARDASKAPEAPRLSFGVAVVPNASAGLAVSGAF